MGRGGATLRVNELRNKLGVASGQQGEGMVGIRCGWVRVSLAAALAWGAAAAPAGGQTLDAEQSAAYADCMGLARLQPEQAFETALTWQSAGGGAAAQHCAAVALLGLGRYEDAARRLEQLAQGMTADPQGLRADILAQSGQAWLIAGDIERAHAVQTAALDIDPENVELLIDRSITFATTGSYWDAVDDLNRAIDLAPERADVLVLRSSAYRRLDALELAGDDVTRALMLDPENPEGLLERGILHRLWGEADRARADWIQVLTLAPSTPAADAARAHLEELDVKVE